MTFELFHRIAHPESARVRRFLTEHHMTDLIRYRNIDASEAAHSDLLAMGFGEEIPVLRTPETILRGADAILKFLEAKKPKA